MNAPASATSPSNSSLSNCFAVDELLALGFESVADSAAVSRDARLFSISGRLGEHVRIDAYAILTGKIVLGNRTHISPFCFLGGTGGGIELADGAGLSTHVSVFSKSADYRTDDLPAGNKIEGPVHIGRHSIVGAGSTIMPGTRIGADVSVGCHCVIAEDLPDGARVVSRGTGLVSLSRRPAGR